MQAVIIRETTAKSHQIKNKMLCLQIISTVTDLASKAIGPSTTFRQFARRVALPV